MGAFSGLAGASRGYNSNSFREGRIVARIDACDFYDTDAKGEMWKNTLTVLAVEDGTAKVGEVVHTFFRVSAGKKIFQQNLKAFLAGVMNVADDQVGDDDGPQAAGEYSPMLGRVTVVTARLQASKNMDDDGNPRQYPVYTWSAELTPEEIVTAIGEDGVARFFPNGLEE